MFTVYHSFSFTKCFLVGKIISQVSWSEWIFIFFWKWKLQWTQKMFETYLKQIAIKYIYCNLASISHLIRSAYVTTGKSLTSPIFRNPACTKCGSKGQSGWEKGIKILPLWVIMNVTWIDWKVQCLAHPHR